MYESSQSVHETHQSTQMSSESQAASAYQAPSVMVSSAELHQSLGDVGKYGKDTAAKRATGSETCRISSGFDQPADFNMQGMPLVLTSSVDCCNACLGNSRRSLILSVCLTALYRMQVLGVASGQPELLPEV